MKTRTEKTATRRTQAGIKKTLLNNLKEKTRQEKKDYKLLVEKMRIKKGLEPHKQYSKITNKRRGKISTHKFVPYINEERKNEKLVMLQNGLKNRKQLRKFKKAQKRTKA